ncbi:hypothetical protein Hanom_Chr04g00307321 [Helianthus anomalus]
MSGDSSKRGGGERMSGPMRSFFFFFFNKKPSHLRGECRHQFRVLEEFKRGVDVAHEDWFGVRERTHLLVEHPLHPNLIVTLRSHFLADLIFSIYFIEVLSLKIDDPMGWWSISKDKSFKHFRRGRS